MASHEAPEVHRGVGAMRRKFIAGDDGRERLSFSRRVEKPELMLITACSQDEMLAVVRTQACAQVWPIRRRKSQFAGIGWACDKNDSARPRFGKPENIGFIRGERRVYREIATPSAVRRRRRRSPKRLEIWGWRSRRDILRRAAEIPRRWWASSNYPNGHIRSTSANSHRSSIFSRKSGRASVSRKSCR